MGTPDRVFIFDTTLRDGEQSPGFHLDANSKVRIARQLEKLGVDVIEAGFPVTSRLDFEACRRIAREIRGAGIAALARAVREDIDIAWAAIKEAEKPQIHIVLSVSDIKSVVASQLALEASVAPSPPAQLTVSADPNQPDLTVISILYWDAQSGVTVSFSITA